MASLKDAIAYVHNHYPESQTKLSVDRLIKIIYLADWKYAITSEFQMTEVQWEILDFQPWMDKKSVNALLDVLSKIRVGKLLRISPILNSQEKETIKFVIETALHKTDKELDRLVNSTHPAIVGNNLGNLNLTELAADYEKTVKTFPSDQ